MEEVKVSRFNFSKRHLEINIELFNFDDPVPIHTLAASVYSALRDINKW